VGWNPELDAVDNVFLIGAVMGLSLAEIRQKRAYRCCLVKGWNNN